MTGRGDPGRTAPHSRELVDGYTLAAFIGVHPSTLRQWARRGHITVRGYDQQGRARYDAAEVLRHAGWQDRLAS